MKISTLCSFLSLTVFAHSQAPQFELRDGDRVLFVGDALLERENTLGHLEARLHAVWPKAKFSVRNLSWAGDTPRGWSRASFDGPTKGTERLNEQIALVKPTVVFLGYGMAASLQEVTDRSNDTLLNRDTARYGEEPMSAGRFKSELSELMTEIEKAGDKPRFVLISPIPHEDLRATRPGTIDPSQHNELLKAYSKAIEALAKERAASFVDLFEVVGALESKAVKESRPTLTQNGIHLTDAANAAMASALVQSLHKTSLLTDIWKPDPALEASILRKNDLFFHRSRPANSTYLFGFRKHEQGRNAVEIPQYDPLVDSIDNEIDSLKRGKSPAKESANTAAAQSPAAEPQPIPNFTVEDGYEITLWADSNLVGKPVGMNWDAKGRLWVACSPVYPMIAPGAHPEDKVVVIEDTNKDGKADKSTTFATNLLIAAGVAPEAVGGKAGATPNAAYVGSSTELVHITDTNGDGKGDVRRVVLSGFGTEDTHHTIHTLKWGPDGRLYFNQSIYIHSHLETPYGMVRLNSAGIFAYDPRTERTEVIAKGWCNPWGNVWDTKGQQFVTDGAGFQGVSWLVPGAMYFTYENAKRIMPSVSPGNYPKFCGLELVHSPLFPSDWQGNAVTCDFRAHRIARFSFNDLSPAKSGYETKAEADLVRTTDTAFRPIDVKTGPDGALYVADWTNPVINHGEVDFRDPRRDHVNGRIWRIAPKGKAPLAWGAFETAVKAPVPQGRDDAQAATLVRDAQPRVRIEAMRALSKKPDAKNAPLILEAALKAPANDEHYAHAAWLSVNDFAPHLMEWVDSPAAAANPAGVGLILENLPVQKTGPLLAKLIAKNGLPKDGSGPWIELIGRAGGPKECEKLLELISMPRAAAALVVAAKRGVKPEGSITAEFVRNAPPEITNDLLRLVGLWKLDYADVLAAAISPKQSNDRLDAAFEGLATLRTPNSGKQLETFIAGPDASMKRRALAALAAFKPAAALSFLSAVSAGGDEAARLALFRALFQNDVFKAQFVKAVPADLSKPAAVAALRAARELGRKGEGLVNVLTPIAGVNPSRDANVDLAAQVRLTEMNGNAAEGEEIYRRLGLACTACHAIGGAGGKVGPDLTTIGASAPLDYLVESLFMPNAKVKEGYNAVMLNLKGGKVANGVVLRETSDTVFLRDAAGNESSVAKGDITARENIGSIMPAGLLNSISDREKSHVFAFLSQLGKPGPFDATKASVARVWWLYPGKDETTVITSKAPAPGAKALTFTDGRLPKATLTEALQMVPDAGDSVLAVARFSGAGKTRLQLQGVTKAWLDGAALAIASNPSPEVDLSAGDHTLTVKLETKSLPAVLRAECPEGRFATE